ncbi:Bug family tripartite tricarboxylate transporter substrate binding protein [Plastoroseomonas arctica]|uniref:Tripartite tricarboxylate transporter substrate binding protein n=1 Tax=Plastoroseomonas arctica TaxID=1509237 RepID=A0AAF1JWW1_9PROT|nr:tripartite tricarboxylate transporter substrate-binding protein [Plastoroseomonas arctica]MBR0654216.1 tripartite tricarboxylate transporter substrate binding protein [Plastoroseomonas arctica]
MLLRRHLPALAAGLLAAPAVQAQRAWEPQRPVQLIVPAGTGGGADQMARIIQGIITRHSLMRQPMMVVNKPGGAGAEGFLEARNARANPHVLVITLSNLFTTPLSTGIPFSWRDLTPVAMLALDEFCLWVNAASPWTTLAEFVAASGTQRMRMGGTGSRQEDQIITVAIQRATGSTFTYVPFRGGGEVATQLVGNHIDCTVNNPIEAVTHWRSGTLRPLCVFDRTRLPGEGRITETMGWQDIPTAKEAGLDVEYLMLRGIFAAPGLTPPQLAFYSDLLGRVVATPEWRELMATGAFNTTMLAGEAFRAWLTEEEVRHRSLMQEAGFIGAGG